MKELLLLLAGASIALFSTWVKSWVDRESHCSNEVFKQRISCMNQIWSSFYEVKSIFGNKIAKGQAKWISQHHDEALEKLNAFRKLIDESQIVLSKEIVNGFRELDSYLFVLIGDEDQHPSRYVAELNAILEKLSMVINENMNVRTHKVDLHLST
jgi:hypothetical protein